MLPRLLVSTLMFLPVLLAQGSVAHSASKTLPPVSRLPPPPPGDASWTLGLRLYQAIRSDSSSVNTVFSPVLVASLLGAVGGGSAGATASQFHELLKSSAPAKAVTQAGEVVSESLKSFTASNGSSFRLHLSSAVFSKETPAISQVFLKDAEGKFKVQHHSLGKGDGEADLKQLRGWAEAILGEREEAPSAAKIQAKAGALILASAFRFKGLWEREFSEDGTDRRTFLGKKYTKVAMMHRAGLYRFHEDVEKMVQVIEAPLWGNKASMALLMPFHVEGLQRLDKLLSVEQLFKWLDKANKTSMSVSLPVANITSILSLQDQLSALGLTDAWDHKVADFSGVSVKSEGRVHLGGVLQWASLELAAQAGNGDGKQQQQEEVEEEEEQIDKPKLFYADHPFIVLVRDNATGSLLLIGALDHVEGEALHDEL